MDSQQQQPPDPSGPPRCSEEGESKMRVDRGVGAPSQLFSWWHISSCTFFFSFFLAVQHMRS